MSTIDESDDVSAQLRQLEQLTREIDNFRDIARYILPTPGEVPRLQGLDIFGGTLPLSGSVGGDHLIYVDFKQRFDLDARIALAREQGRPDLVDAPRMVPAQGGHRARRRVGAPHDRRAAGRDAAPGVPARRHLRARRARPHHAPAVRAPQHALLPVVGRAQVRLAHLRRDGRRRHVPLPRRRPCRSRRCSRPATTASWR